MLSMHILCPYIITVSKVDCSTEHQLNLSKIRDEWRMKVSAENRVWIFKQQMKPSPDTSLTSRGCVGLCGAVEAVNPTIASNHLHSGRPGVQRRERSQDLNFSLKLSFFCLHTTTSVPFHVYPMNALEERPPLSVHHNTHLSSRLFAPPPSVVMCNSNKHISRSITKHFSRLACH